MISQRDRNGLNGLSTLLNTGTAVGLTDGQLLECFATRGGEDAEMAFGALVERHGAMVLRTCLAVLRDEHDARDAFQATFLILARRGGSLWVRDSIGPWLHRVARHAAVRVRRDADRRRVVERGAVLAAVRSTGPAGEDDLAAVVHEEVDRLPERYRVPVVLCDLEGRTHEEAARHLGCPVGTIKSRLARGRERLRVRLTRRGLAPGATLAGPLRAALPKGLAESTIGASMRLAPAGAGTVPAVIAGGVIRSMFLAQLGGTLMKAIFGIAIGIGLLVYRPGVPARQEPAEKPRPGPAGAATPKAAASEEPLQEYAWRRVDRYEPPDFERFFPDDSRAGAELNELAAAKDRDKSPAADVLRIVRRGLRRTTADRRELLGWVGSRFVWDASPQDPEAIEILYHANDFRGPLIHFPESPMIYFGLMRVDPKTPAILHAMVDWCMHVERLGDWGWVAWAGRKQRAELLAYFEPYRKSGDKATRDRAVVVEKRLSEAPDAGEAYLAWSREKVLAKSGQRLPDMVKSLRIGGSRERLQALKVIAEERLTLLIDESFLKAVKVCARDEDPEVRRAVALVLGGFIRFDRDGPIKSDAIDILFRLSKDEDPRVRYDAVYSALTPLPEIRHDDIVRRLVEVAIVDRRPDLVRRIGWALKFDADAAGRILNDELTGPDPARAEGARAIYKELAGRTPPAAGAAGPEGRKEYVKAFRDLYEHLGKVYPSFAIKGIDWEKVGRELLPRVEAVETEQQFGLLVEELVARLEDSHAYVHEGSATPPSAGLPEWDPWLACLIDDRGKPVLYAVSPRTPAWKAEVRPGMTVLSVNGIPAAEAMDRWMKQQRRYVGYSSERYLRYDAARLFHRQMQRGAPVALELEDVDGRTLGVRLKAEGRGWYIPRLPVPRQGIEDGGADVQWVRLEDKIGYLQVRRIRQGLEVSLDQALTALGDIKGLILDVRGNSGGGFDTNTAFRNFDVAPAGGGVPHEPLYRRPIAMLIDERCISAGEGWASWFVARKRARLFGTTTAGASARKETYTLSNGLYKVQIPVKAYTGFLDRPIERRGLEPDVEVRCTARDIARGRDTVVEAAMEWLRKAGRE